VQPEKWKCALALLAAQTLGEAVPLSAVPRALPTRLQQAALEAPRAAHFWLGANRKEVLHFVAAATPSSPVRRTAYICRLEE
jgi:hypothetical protein